jgi:hypothetical protein
MAVCNEFRIFSLFDHDLHLPPYRERGQGNAFRQLHGPITVFQPERGLCGPVQEIRLEPIAHRHLGQVRKGGDRLGVLAGLDERLRGVEPGRDLPGPLHVIRPALPEMEVAKRLGLQADAARDYLRIGGEQAVEILGLDLLPPLSPAERARHVRIGDKGIGLSDSLAILGQGQPAADAENLPLVFGPPHVEAVVGL